MIVDNIEQRSLDWFRSRIGSICGSKISDIMKTGRKKDDIWSDTAKSYLYQVAGERMFNPVFLNDDDVFNDYLAQTSFTSKAMQWGIDQESEAISLYKQLEHPDDELVDVSSCKHDTIPHFAASPDGLIYFDRPNGKFKVLEVKCPNVSTFMRYRAEIHDGESLKSVKPEYYWQVMAEMDCTGASCATFITYCPWLSKPIHWADIERNEDDIKLMEERVVLANEFIQNIINTK